MQKNSQIKSRKRVVDHGEVFTSEREVNAMLDLVYNETQRIDSRFLEPACGDGNFLVQILNRKFGVINSLQKTNISEISKNYIIAISSIYGVELLEDNVKSCRQRLLDTFADNYRVNHSEPDVNLLKVAKYILGENIICGDALSLKDGSIANKPLVFSEWSFIGEKVKRRQYTLSELLETAPSDDDNLFSDMWDEIFIPRPIKEFPLMHYMKVGELNNEK